MPDWRFPSAWICGFTAQEYSLKGLRDAAKCVVTSLVGDNFGLPVSASHYEGTQTTDYWEEEAGKEDFPIREYNLSYEKKKTARPWNLFDQSVLAEFLISRYSLI